MGTITAARAARNLSASFQTFPLGKGNAMVFDAAASPPLPLEVRTDCSEVIDELYPLYRAVADRSTVKFEIFTRDYFLEASRALSGRCRFFIWRQAGRTVAFCYCTIWQETLFDHDLGLDYAVAHSLHLYYVTFRDLVQWALSNGLRTYRTSLFNYEPKMHLRLALEPVDLFVRHRSSFLNAMLRIFAPLFSPTRSDPVLRRHFFARS